jgi:hypothetical protein
MRCAELVEAIFRRTLAPHCVRCSAGVETKPLLALSLLGKPPLFGGPLQPVLLECKRWSVAGGILRSSMTLRRGCHLGQEHQGRPSPPMREILPSPLVVLLGRPVDSRLDSKER